MPEFELVGLVKSQPLEFTPSGAMKIRRHLHKVGWRFGWLLFWQQLIMSLGYLINLIFHFKRKRLLPAWLLAKENDIPVIECINVNDPLIVKRITDLRPDLII